MILSLIIPAYKVERYLERCLDSCLKQDTSPEDYEIVIVDDGSPDRCGEIADNYALTYCNVSVIHKVNGGLSSARNCGLDVAQGDYVWFIDSDDWIAENKLSRIVDTIKQYNPDAVRIEAINVNGEQFESFYSLSGSEILTGRDTLLTLTLPCVPFFIWRKELFKTYSLRFVEGILHEDMEFTPQAICRCDTVVNIPEAMYYVYVNDESITRRFNPKKSFDYINPVCVNLFNFSHKLSGIYKCKIDYFIAMCINNAISNINDVTGDVMENLNQSIKDNKVLLKSFWNSGCLKYKIEFLLLILSCGRFVQTFRLMDRFYKIWR